MQRRRFLIKDFTTDSVGFGFGDFMGKVHRSLCRECINAGGAKGPLGPFQEQTGFLIQG